MPRTLRVIGILMIVAGLLGLFVGVERLGFQLVAGLYKDYIQSFT